MDFKGRLKIPLVNQGLFPPKLGVPRLGATDAIGRDSVSGPPSNSCSKLQCNLANGSFADVGDFAFGRGRANRKRYIMEGPPFEFLG